MSDASQTDPVEGSVAVEIPGAANANTHANVGMGSGRSSSGSSSSSSGSDGEHDDEEATVEANVSSKRKHEKHKLSQNAHVRSPQSRSSGSDSARFEPVIGSSKTVSQFIDVTMVDLVSQLAQHNATRGQAWVKDWKKLAGLLQLHTLIRTQKEFKRIALQYDTFDPAAPKVIDGSVRMHAMEHRSDAGLTELLGSLDELLHTCGYQVMPPTFLQEAKEKEGRYGLDVRVPPEEEVPIVVYYRGMQSVKETVKSWKTCFRARQIEEKLLSHLVMIYRFNIHKDDAPVGCTDKLEWTMINTAKRKAVGPEGSEGKVFVRVYDSIPLYDIDMLWPASSPNPTLLDALIVLVPLAIGLGTSIYKIWTLMSDEHNLSDGEDLAVILLAIVAPFMAAFKGFTKAKSKFMKYKAHHAETLVQRTVSTNRGAIMQLLAEASEQENKEFLLAYTALAAAEGPMPMEAVKTRVEAFLTSLNKDSQVDFDIVDVVSELEATGILVRHDDGRLGVVDVQTARQKLSLAQFE